MNNFWKDIKKPISAMAPMDDVTDFVFREMICEIAKPDVIYTEFTSAEALASKGRDKVLSKLKYSEKQRPVVAQIWGSDPSSFSIAAKLIEELGFDGIDINMGCPDKSVFARNAGAALVGNFDLPEKLITAVKDATTKLPLSVKIRIDQTPDQTDRWVTYLLKLGIQALIIHGRTRKQMFRGLNDWDQISSASKLREEIEPNTLVIGNGDVKSYEEICEKSGAYGLDGIMVGRAVLSNPPVFSKTKDVPPLSAKDGLKLLSKHADLYNKTWGGTKNYENIKKYIRMYLHSFDGADVLRKNLMLCRNYTAFKEVLDSANIN